MNYLRNNAVLITIIAALLIVNLGLLYYGFWRDEKHERRENPERVDRGRMKLEKEVGFNEQQLNQFEELRQKNRQDLKPMFEELRIAKDSFYSLLYLPDIPDSLITQRANAVSEKQEAIDRKMFQHFNSLKKIATPDQKVKLDSFMSGVIRKMSGYRPERSKEKSAAEKRH